jgi:hypothetical protein
MGSGDWFELLIGISILYQAWLLYLIRGGKE